MNFNLQYNRRTYCDEIVIDQWRVWASPSWSFSGSPLDVFDSEGFIKVEAIKSLRVWIIAPQELREYYYEHEEEIKQEARKLIVKEML